MEPSAQAQVGRGHGLACPERRCQGRGKDVAGAWLASSLQPPERQRRAHGSTESREAGEKQGHHYLPPTNWAPTSIGSFFLC